MATEKRLIDANAEIATIKENICKNCNSHNGVRCLACWADDVIGFLEDAPTVDAVEVVHGRWEKHLAPYTDDYWTCTCCNGNFMTDAAQYWHYCPNCGAKMDKNENP